MIIPSRSTSTFKGAPLCFVMMRLNLKVTLLCVCIVAICTTFSFWSRCGDATLKEWPPNFVLDAHGNEEEIDCLINGDYTIGCHKEGDEVYVPFSFIHKYFEIFGKLSTTDGVERFEWTHSVGKVYRPKGKYDPRGVFMHFENFNVEARDRVKCVSAIDGVPISTQWESHGYPYPTQIAQFGLAHYSKNLTEPEPRRKVVEDGDKEAAKWHVPKTSTLSRYFDSEHNTFVLNFSTDAQGIKLQMDHVLDFVLSVHLSLSANSSLTMTLQNREKKDVYHLHYIANDVLLSVQDENFYHGIGVSEKWHKLTRDLQIDLQKGVSFIDKEKKRKLPRSKLKLVAISLYGRGRIDNLTLSTSEHMMQFYDAAEWFVANQDALGGWAIPVKRKLAAGFQDLEPGWYSAMGQGQAISVLTRAFHHSGEKRYLRAALDALKPFKVPHWQGGVLAMFLNKFHWYEEYPTKPSSFVLNGFIYSLLGLYDLIAIAPAEQRNEAEMLYEKGMLALKSMLTLFDMGSTTAYDLRHFTLGIAPNLARWDYHVTHINQLLLLSTIVDNEPIYQQTVERWIGYMSGKRAAHN